MAKVIGSLQCFDKNEGESWPEHDARTSKLMDEMHAQSDNLPEGTIVGGIIRFPFADGHAIYQVHKAKPLQLAHVPYGDAWQANEITIRGLNAKDVELMLKRNKAIPKLKSMITIPSYEAAKEALETKYSTNLESHELTPFKTLYKRPDGQVFGISHTGNGEYQSVVPSDLADAGEGYQHKYVSEAESYLWELIYKEINVDKRFVDAVSNAENAFWAEIANAYPEIKTGDLGPDIVVPFKIMMEKAVAAWLTLNAPEGTDIVNLVHSNLVTNDVGKTELEVVHQTQSSDIPSQNQVESIKKTYPVGTRVRVDKMDDTHAVPVGTYGTVKLIDGAGQLHVNWDNGSTLALIPNVDEFTVLTISLADFVASKVFSNDVERSTGCDNSNPGTKGYVYMGSYYIEQLEDGSYYLPISRDEYASKNLEELEKILYDQHFSL